MWTSFNRFELNITKAQVLGAYHSGAMDKKKLIRRIVDYLHKYATEEQLLKIAHFLNIN